jgi:hypothetical protein
MSRLRRSALFLGIPAVVLVGSYLILHEYVRAAAFVAQAAGMTGVVASAAELEAGDVSERGLSIPWRNGELPGRWYEPDTRDSLPVLLVPGVHASGIEEPRLVGVARDLASVGTPVLTAELADLRRYAITPRSTDMIEDAAVWLSRQAQLTPSGRFGKHGGAAARARGDRLRASVRVQPTRRTQAAVRR